MILEIVQYGNPVLREKGREVKAVDGKITQLAADMLETMRSANGVGLAAQQIGVPLQMTVIDVADIEDRPSAMFIGDAEVKVEDYMPLVLLNPVLQLSKDKETGSEGCLSFPELSADITRASGVRCKALRLEGSEMKEFEFDASGLLARALQHEVDHLHGILFIDRMNTAAKASVANRLKRLQREVRRG
ncbi:MAG: peptide deformylase [Verrucomicrobia bacterium]|nr:MAG: peptide deformylase [Verrucomicrobiota bacterium]